MEGFWAARRQTPGKGKGKRGGALTISDARHSCLDVSVGILKRVKQIHVGPVREDFLH